MLNTNTKLKYTMAHAVANKAEPGQVDNLISKNQALQIRHCKYGTVQLQGNKGSRVALELLTVNYIIILSLMQ